MLSEGDSVKIEIYDIKGRKVDEPLNKFMESGKHSVTWNSKNIPSGVYFYKITIPDTTITRKLVLFK